MGNGVGSNAGVGTVVGTGVGTRVFVGAGVGGHIVVGGPTYSSFKHGSMHVKDEHIYVELTQVDSQQSPPS